MIRLVHFRILLFLAVLLIEGSPILAQVDTTRKVSIDSIILRQKGIIGQLAQNLLTDTSTEHIQGLQRTDQPFQRYNGKIIRSIRVQTFEFEITDTSKRFS